MDKRIIATVAALAVAIGAGEVLAAGKGNGGGGMRGGFAGTRTTTTTRPADSQRRDGTFLTTGTTANGSATRPSNANGKGLRDGSGLSTTTTTAQ